MRVVVQRVSRAQVSVAGEVRGSIGRGLLVLLGIEPADTEADADWLAQKIVRLRVFSDAAGVMNLDLGAVGGSVLVVSQFTLVASYRKGNRPSYLRAAGPDVAVPLYEYFCRQIGQLTGQPPQTGEFGADMQVELLNDGPVTICMDSKNRE